MEVHNRLAETGGREPRATYPHIRARWHTAPAPQPTTPRLRVDYQRNPACWVAFVCSAPIGARRPLLAAPRWHTCRRMGGAQPPRLVGLGSKALRALLRSMGSPICPELISRMG